MDYARDGDRVCPRGDDGGPYCTQYLLVVRATANGSEGDDE